MHNSFSHAHSHLCSLYSTPFTTASDRPLDFLFDSVPTLNTSAPHQIRSGPETKQSTPPTKPFHNPFTMPPKVKGNEPPKKKATVEDKTFGMKNKKGGQAKRQIAQLAAQAKSNKSPEEKRKEAEKEQKAKDKAASELAKAEAAELFKPVQIQKVPFGVDPKTVLCQFFKQGHCEKGRKCKFSHDPDVGRKGAKRDLYQDTREQEREEKEKDKMEDWDEEKLRNVVLNKHGNPRTTTDKVCKFFISAVEDGKYGWFWTCPNGGDKCMYRHSLPAGYAHFCPVLSKSLLTLCPQIRIKNQGTATC